MADHRSFFRPRRLAFGGRLAPHACFLAVSLSLFSPAHAEDAGLKNGAASLAAGKYDTAVRQFSATINADSVAPGEAAKALYLRGIAYRKLNQPSRAIADFGAAMWLGLPEGDRVKALVNRGLAYQSAGLASQGQADIALARKSGGGAVDQLVAEGGGSAEGAASIAAFSTSVTPESQGSNAQASAAPAVETPAGSASGSGQWTTTANAETSESASSGNRVSRWWGSVTGSSSSESAASAPAEATAPTPAPTKPPAAPSTGWGAQTQAGEAGAASAPPPAPSTGWGAQTEQTANAAAPTSPPPASSSPARAPSTGWGAQTQGGEAVVASDASPSQSRWSRWFSKSAEAETAAGPAAPVAAPAASGGGFQLQLATSRSEQEAQALWKKVSSENQQVAAVQPMIEKVDIGDFGTFYSLKIGPFTDKAESLKVCNALKRSGVDCSLVTQ
jgi:hypothetical protein